MCKAGDIICIDHYVDRGMDLSRHSFVVLSDVSGEIQGLAFDLVCNVMSSFKSEEQKQLKLGHPGNFPVTYEDEEIPSGNQKSGYIKSEQLYYFKKDKMEFTVIGSLTPETFQALTQYIVNLQISIENITDNLL